MYLFPVALSIAKREGQPVRVAVPEMVGPEGCFAMAFYNVSPNGRIATHGLGNPMPPHEFRDAYGFIITPFDEILTLP